MLAAPRVARLSVPIDPFRACELCTHGRSTSDAGRVCTDATAVQLHGQGTPVQTVRARGGACGPDAAKLDFPGLHP
jgi:hypothetical protein